MHISCKIPGQSTVSAGVTARSGGFLLAVLLSVGGWLLLSGAAGAQNKSKAASASGKPVAHSPSASQSKKKGRKSRKTAKRRKRGQEKIDAARAQEIQEALIREHYLDGSATGVWDTDSQRAMERYQADNGWQSKTVPDARALIKLGLGPDHEHLLNPESAMTSQLPRPHAAPVSTAAPSREPAADPPQR